MAGGGVRLYDWQQANASFFNAIQVERNVMFLILTLIILVAAFNITHGSGPRRPRTKRWRRNQRKRGSSESGT
jgi:hypothetical protein